MSTLVSTTCSGDGTITTFTLDGDELRPLATSPIGKGVNCLAPDATGRHGWAGTKEPVGIATIDLDEESGRWQVSERTEAPDSLTYLQASGDGKWLLGCSYGGGWGQVWPVTDGRLGEPTARIEYPNLHCIVERDGFVHAVSLGADLVASYRLTDDGALEPLAEPTLAAPQGSGPRHLTLDAEGRNAYLVTEYSGEVIRLQRDPATGALTARESVSIVDPSAGLEHSRMGADPVEEHLVWGADVHLAGGFLVGSERCASTLASVALDEDGHLGEVVSLVGTEQQPRGFTTTGDGRHVVCPGEKSEQLSLFRVGDDGALERVAQVPNGAGANWVRLLEH